MSTRIVFDDSEMTATQDEHTGHKRSRGRSKSLVRAKKSREGTLQSQQRQSWEAELDETGWDTPGMDRSRSIAAAIEANCAFAKNGTAAWPDCSAWRPKSMFDLYYKLIRVVERHEWEDFAAALRKPLPVTFRFVVDNVTPAFRAEGEAILERWAALKNGTRRLGRVDGWQLQLDKHELRQAEAGSEAAALREWLIRGTDDGMLVRQEVASMLPGTLIDVQPNDIVLDMCASPGSKTTQLVERLSQFASGGGVVVANDASALRAYTLVKRTASLGARAASLVVTCHRGQVMPRPGGEDETSGGFDRIICDVPCTGDGTTRKHPEVFGRWEVALAMRQHPLQLQIAMRGVALLNVGGVMCYSTCSLNPIEDESVVAEVLRRCGGAIELLDGADEVATELAGGCGPGMEQWPMLDFRLRRQPSLEALRASAEVPEGEKRMYMRSMWPPSAQEAKRLHLSRCVRLLPHRSDSGGFFVALLKKVRPLPAHPEPSWSRGEKDADGSANRTVEANGGGDAACFGPKEAKEDGVGAHCYAPIPTPVLSRIAPMLGASGGDATQSGRARGAKAAKKEARESGQVGDKRSGLGARLFSRSSAASRIVYMNPACERLCVDGRLNVVHAGATVLTRRRRRSASMEGGSGGPAEPPQGVDWAITKEGVQLLQSGSSSHHKEGAQASRGKPKKRHAPAGMDVD